jgi:hypothetical protein
MTRALCGSTSVRQPFAPRLDLLGATGSPGRRLRRARSVPNAKAADPAPAHNSGTVLNIVAHEQPCRMAQAGRVLMSVLTMGATRWRVNLCDRRALSSMS